MTDPAAVLREVLRRERGLEAVTVEEQPGGANSRVYKMVTAVGLTYLAKWYLRRPGDQADRLETEYNGLSFLWRNGVRAVPEPVCRDDKQGIGIYGFVGGRKLSPGEVSAAAVSQAADLLGRLRRLAHEPDAAGLPAAKESCFTLAAYLEVVRGRLALLEAIPPKDDETRRLSAWIGKEFRPHFEETRASLEEGAAALGIDAAAELPAGVRTLSPSDFGFHNAIRRADGSIVFIDFEYWGWDDPVKTVADFFLQPAVPVPAELRKPFFDQVASFYEREDLERRLPLAFPVLALKWCLIMLNSFLRPEDAGRRAAQLDKAAAYLGKARAEFEGKSFPLSLR